MHAWTEINLDRLRENFKNLKKYAGHNIEIVPVLKAQAYGCGSEMAAKVLEKCGAKFFAVVNTDEAVLLRSKGIRKPILNIGALEPEQYAFLWLQNIQQTLYDFPQTESLARWALSKQIRLSVHVKIDTGMGRLGFRPEETDRLIGTIKKWCSLRVVGICTHLSSADEKNKTFTLNQIKIFRKVVSSFKEAGIYPKWVHAGNSAGLIRYAREGFNMARVGLALYGQEPFRGASKKVRIKPVMSFKTKVISIKDVPAGSPVSYCHTFFTKRPTRIAILSAGYADGIDLGLSNRGRVLIKGESYPIIGRVTMNLTIVDIGNNKSIRPGDEVVLIGRSGKREITLQEIADMLGSITWEMHVRISARVPRIYICGGRKIEGRRNSLI